MAQLPLQQMDIRVLLTKITTFPIIFACLYCRLHMFVLYLNIYIYICMYVIPLICYSKNELRHLCPLHPIQTPEKKSMGSNMNCAICVP